MGAVFRIFAVLILLMLVWSVQAQQPYFATKHYTTDHGLPSPEVYDILEDRRGYLWFSTDNGVSRFNGYAFENFGPKQGLQNNVVFFLQEDAQGRIWMPTLSGNVYYFEKDTIKPFPHNHILLQHRNQYRQIGDFYVDKNGVFYAGLRGLGIIIIQPSGEYQLMTDDLPCGAIIYEVDDHFLNVFVPCLRDSTEMQSMQSLQQQNRLNLYFLRGKEQQKVEVDNDLPGQLTGEAVIKLQDGQLLCYRRGFLYYFDQKKQLLWAYRYPWAISFLGQSKDGRLFISDARGKGIRAFENVEAIRQEKYTRYFNGNTVSHIWEDELGGIWFATIDNGVFYGPNQNYEVYNERSGLSNDYVTSVAARNESEVFIGLHNGDIFRLNLQNDQLQPLPSSGGGHEIFDLEYEAGRDRLWRGARNLEYLADGQWHQLSNRVTPLNAANKKFSIYPGTDLILGASSGSSGFALVRLSTAELFFYTNTKPKLKGRTLVTYQDFSGRIWVGRINGFFELVNDSLQRPANFPAAFNYRVEDIRQLRDSTFVIGTKGGGVTFWKDTLFFQLSDSDGLTASMIENIHVDAAQNIWVGTLNGLNHVRWEGPDHFSVEQLTIAHGLPSNEINDITSWKRNLWVATTRGLVRLPYKTTVDSQAKAPILEELLINNRPVALDSKLRLPYHKNHFQLHCLTINYKLNGQINYRYRLKPDNDWILTQERHINLAALAPGGYHFEIQSQNEDGFWSDSAELFFLIKPPFWQTIWFWGMVGLLLIGSGWYFYQFRMQQLRREAQLEREKVAIERQVIELKQSALRAQMNPHFIFNCLNSIQGYIAIGDKGKATRYLSRFAKLIRATLDATLESSITLKRDVEILENYLEMEQMRFKEKFDYQVVIGEDVDPFEIEVPPLLVQPYVENAIVHGLVEPVKAGSVAVTYERENGHLKVSVTDNGIGILESKRRKSKQAVKQKSRGMSITRRRLELLDQATRNNKVIAEELKNKSGEVLGTRVTLRIRLEKGRG